MQPTEREYIIWSRHGLWRSILNSEIEANTVVKATANQIEADLIACGYCLTWCDTEPVAVFPWYPDQEPEEVIDWVNQAQPSA